jgi:hypothetical protein
MAACIVEDALATTSIYCQTTNKMERTPSSSSSSLETSTRTTTTSSTTTNPDLHRCSFNFHTNNSTLIINQEPSRKRQLSQSETKRTVTETSCRSQAVPINKPNESKKKNEFFLNITSSLTFQL